MSIVSCFLLSRFVAPNVDFDPSNAFNRLLIVSLGVLAIFLVTASFLVKRRFLAQSIDRQDVVLVHKGHIVAWALCDGAGVLGFIERFVGYRQYYLLMLLAAIGIAVHFPKREHLLAATYKTLTNKVSF